MSEEEYDMENVVQHTEGLAEDNDISFAEAAAMMPEHLDGLKTKDILEAN